MRSWGLEDQVRRGAADVLPFAWVCRTLASQEGARMPLGYPSPDEMALITPTGPAWAPQNHLEPLLLQLLGSQPSATV
ncbi:MAG: hypothetical protein WCG47_13925, partial [Dermatophilaceae bacterium]